ncbi:MAG: outer membrane protein assembly factor BamD [Burkholderiaceae bacterium]|nr:outer membrane protein assembly factor BamD [Burkholderiaceae bacterium]
MGQRLRRILPVVLALSLALSGCGLLPEEIDETADWPAGKLYREAKDQMAGGDYEKAIKYLEKLEARYPFGVYAQQAQIEVAYAYYRDNDQPQALAAVERFIKLHPNHPNIDYMYYLRGLINFNDRVGIMNFAFKQDLSERDPKAAQEAFDSFRMLVTRFPESLYAPDATVRMRYLLNMLARHEIHVARYYFTRGAYLASVNRAQTVLSRYSDTPSSEDAMFILVRAYDKLGLTELRDDADRVFRQNFPDSVLPKGGTRELDDVWWKFW